MLNFQKTVNALLEYGNEILKNQDDNLVILTKNYPVSFVLCCLADKNINADIAWSIHKYIKDYSFAQMEKFTSKKWKDILTMVKYNRASKVSEEFVFAIKHIRNKYDGHAERIWTEAGSFSEIIARFLEFKGIGIKIATMAANLLSRYFEIGKNFVDRNFMDISPDTHVKQVFYALGFVDENCKDNKDIIIYTARALNPKQPYLLDLPCFMIGKEYCKKTGEKKCKICPVNTYCKIYNK